jgi:hypothetical protein
MYILRFWRTVISPSDDTLRRDDSSSICSFGIGTCAIVRGFMGCRTVALGIGVAIKDFEVDNGREKSVEFIRSWSKKKRHEISKEKKVILITLLPSLTFKLSNTQSNGGEKGRKRNLENKFSCVSTYILFDQKEDMNQLMLMNIYTGVEGRQDNMYSLILQIK